MWQMNLEKNKIFVPVRGVPLRGIPLFKHEPCPFCLSIMENTCAKVKSKGCKEKIEEYKTGRIRFKDFLSFLTQEFGIEKAGEILSKATAKGVEK